MVLRDPARPAAFEFRRDRSSRAATVSATACRSASALPGVKGPGERRLFQDVARIVRREGFQHAAELARAFDHAGQVGARNLFARAKAQDRALDAHLDQVILQRRLILEVDLGLAARDFVERRLRDVEVAALDQLRHLAEEEGQKQRADMRAVHVGVGHDDDLVVAQLA